jgi:hypothetical protein
LIAASGVSLALQPAAGALRLDRAEKQPIN